MKDSHIHFRVSASLYWKLKEEAIIRGITVSNLIRIILTEYFGGFYG